MSLARIFKRRYTKEANRFYAIHPGILGPQVYIAAMDEDNDDDARSIESFSTTATVDDNPGTGRVLDTYFFQPAGRRIERLAMRFTIRHLHPWRIAAFINRNSGYYLWLIPKWTLSYALQEISNAGNDLGSTIIAGLKSLVRQAQ